jgi:hypothetical protein
MGADQRGYLKARNGLRAAAHRSARCAGRPMTWNGTNHRRASQDARARKEVRELLRADEALKAASISLATELDVRTKKQSTSFVPTGIAWESGRSAGYCSFPAPLTPPLCRVVPYGSTMST